MSTTIDQRVVEMRFDNKQFETNVSTTMSTLDKLKQKLNLDGASKGLNDIGTAAKRVDLSGLSSSADAVAVRFSHMQMSIQRVFDNIVDDAYNTGKRLVKSLSIDQITAGWSKYEKKTANIQTIMNATGKDIDEVNNYLNKLMWFSDETSYGFADMTQALATMTSSGGSIEKLIPLIMGVANATAFAGKGASEFSRVMQYGVNQAYSTGYMMTRDWMTLEGATVGTEQLKRTFIEVAEELGKLEKGAVTIGSFRDSLSDKWLDTEVMEEGFGRFSEFTEAVERLVSGDISGFSEEVQAIYNAGEIQTAADAISVLENSYEELGVKAFKSAQEAKSFTEAIDATKDAVSSSWMKTFELIFGNYEQAKTLWTNITNSLWDIFASGGESRNEFLGQVMNSGWSEFITQVNDAGVSTDNFKEKLKEVANSHDISLDNLIKEYGSFEKVISSGEIKSNLIIETLEKLAGTEKVLNGETKDLTSQFETYQKIVDEIWHGKWDSGSARRAKLTEAGFSYDIAQTLVNISDTRKDLSITMEDFIKVYDKYSDAQLESIGYTEEEIASLRELAKAAKEPGSDLNALIESMQRPSGRELVAETITNSLEALTVVIDTVKTAWGNVFKIKPGNLYKVIKAVHSFSESLVMSEDTAEKLGRTLQGVFSLLKIPTSIISGTFKIAFKTLQLILDKFGMSVLDFTASVGDAITGISDFISAVIDKGLSAVLDWIIEKFGITRDAVAGFAGTVVDTGRDIRDSVSRWINKFNINGLIESIGKATSAIVDNIGKWIEGFKETEFFTTVAGWFESAAQTISDAVDRITERVNNFTASGAFTGFANAFGVLSGGITAIAKKLSNSEIFISIIDGICSAFENIKAFFSGFKLDLNFFRAFTDLFSRFEGVDAKGFTGVMGIVGGFAKDRTILKAKSSFKAFFSMSWDEFKATALTKFTEFWTSFGDKVVAAFEACKEVARAIRDFIFGTEDVHLKDILDLTTKLLWIVTLIKTIQLLNTLTSPVENITSAFENFASSLKWKAIASTFSAMALALGAFTLCIMVICGIEDMSKAKTATAMLISLIIAMGVVVAVMGRFAAKGEGLDTMGVVAALLMLVGSIAILVYVLKEIDQLKLQNPVETFAILFATLLAATMGIRMVAKAGGASFKSVAAILTLVSALSLILGVIKAYDEFDWTGKQSAVNKVAQMLIGLSIAINIMGRGIKEGGNFTGLAAAILAMVFSLKIILSAIREIATMSDAELIRGGMVVSGLLGMMSLMMVVANISSKDAKVLQKGERQVNGFAGFAFALLAVVGAIWLLGKLASTDFNAFVKGAVSVSVILLLFTGLISAIGKSCSGLNTGVIIAMLVGFGALMAELATILYLLKDLDPKSSLANAGALVVLLAAIAGVMLTLKKIDMSISDLSERMMMVLVLGTVIAGLGAVLWAMSKYGTSDAISNAAAITVLLTSMVGVMFALQKLDMRSLNPNKMDKLYVIFGKLALVIAMLGAVLALMSIFNTANAIENATALSILISALAGVTAVIGKIKFNKSADDGVIAFAELSFILFILVGVLQSMNGVENAIENATALSILAMALSVCTIAIAAAGKIAPSAAVGLTALVALASVMTVVVAILSAITGVETARQNAITLGGLAIALSLCALPLALAGVIAPSAATGVSLLVSMAAMLGLLVYHLSTITGVDIARENAITLSNLAIVLSLCTIPLAVAALIAPAAIVGAGLLLALAVVLGLLVWGLSAIDDTSTARANTETIVMLLTSLTNMIAVLCLFGPNAVLAVMALDMLVGLVTKVGVLAAAVGLLTKDGGLIEKGIDLLKKVAKGLGEIVSSFVGGLTSSFPDIGDNFLKFTDALSSIKGSAVAGAGYLSAAVMALLATDFVAGIGKIFGLSLEGVANELNKFSTNIGPFLTAMENVKPEVFTGVKALCDAFNALTKATFWDGLNDFLFGKNSLSAFGSGISDFAVCIKESSETLKDITDEDVGNIKRSAAAGMALADLNAAIPGQDGLWQEWFGSKNLSNWGDTLVDLGKCLIKYSETVSGETFDKAAIEASAAAAKAMSDVNNAIPASGGLWQEWIAGEKNLSNWGATLVEFGKCLVAYSETVTGETFDPAAITRSAEAANALAVVNEAIPEVGGLWQKMAGEQNLETFGSQLKKFGEGLLSYSNVAAQIDQTKIDAIGNTGKAIEAIKEVIALVPDSGGWGEKIFGSNDAGTFGDALVSLASGIADYCAVAATIGDASETVGTLGATITAINTTLEEIPDVATLLKADDLSVAMQSMVTVADRIKELGTGDHSAISLYLFRNAIATIFDIFKEIDAPELVDLSYDIWVASGHLSNTATKLVELNGKEYSGIDTLKAALKAISEFDFNFGELSNKGEDAVGAVKSFIGSMAKGLDGGSSTLETSARGLGSAIYRGITEKAKDLKSAGGNLAGCIATGIAEAENTLRQAGIASAATIANGANSNQLAMITAGGFLGAGLVQGIKSKYTEAYWAAYTLGRQAVLGEKAGQASNSPSKETIKAGKWLGEGLVIGIDRMGKSVYNAGKSMGSNAINSISNSISRISDLVDSGMDTQPTIRPVLDLSDVRAGVGTIGGMFGGTSLGVSANIGAISTMMNSRGQNGGNDDVVSAIDKLRRDLSNVSNNTYQINGVTYDDGSNVHDAISSIVRYARIERRV